MIMRALLSTLGFGDWMLCASELTPCPHFRLMRCSFVAGFSQLPREETSDFYYFLNLPPLPWSPPGWEGGWVGPAFVWGIFAHLKRHNKLPWRSSSSRLQFPFICHFISCSQTFTCIAVPLLNVTAVFVHLQIIVWLITKDWGNLFGGQAVALEFNWGLYCALLMVCHNGNAKNDLVEIAHVCSSHYVHFLFFELQQIQKGWMLAVNAAKRLSTVLKVIVQQRPIVLPMSGKGLLRESVRGGEGFNARVIVSIISM